MKASPFDAFMVQHHPDICIPASLLLPYFFAGTASILMRHVIIALLGGDAVDNSFFKTRKIMLVDDEPDLLKL
jgi:hypothetical protein